MYTFRNHHIGFGFVVLVRQLRLRRLLRAGHKRAGLRRDLRAGLSHHDEPVDFHPS